MNNVLENRFYYLDNFQQVLDWIAERYSDLLTEEEAAFIAAFPALPQPARALLVRMVMRKGTVFRASKLNYAEIGATAEAARPLLAAGWIVRDPVLSLDQVFELLAKPEIAAAFQLTLHERGARKAEQLAALRLQFGQARPYSAWIETADDCALEILVKPLCDRLRLIFFGNAHQDWSEFVLSDLGVYRYEKVEFTPASRGFRTRHDIDAYIDLQHCKERLLAQDPPAEILQALSERHSDNAWIASRRDKLLYQIGEQCEKLGQWQQAHAAYARCPLPGARARCIRVLEKDGQVGAAHALLVAAQAAPEGEAERLQLQRMAPRLARKLGRPVARPARDAPVRELKLALPLPTVAMCVEAVVRDHLHRDAAPVYYVENTLINGLFGLLCWDAIYTAIPGAFFHRFHRGPADLFSADFHARRGKEFAACLAQLEDERYRATILRNFSDKAGIQSPFLDWAVLDAALVEMALDCIPAAHLKKWCERILLDIKANRAGFPDLIQFWPGERRYHMIEVKGPGDRLQDSQLRWIAYCFEHDMPISVCYLQWA